MITKVKNYMRENHMADSGDQIVVGISGGADSVCLLFLLKILSEEMAFSLRAVHVNHRLRAAADEEEAFVKRLCAELCVPCRTETVDAAVFAKEKKLGVEEAARLLRYEVYERVRREAGEDKVKLALAHHMDDQAETVLFHLCRGSALQGLSGIRPVRDFYIRPLLCVTRAEIEEFVRQRRLSFVTDESNFDTGYKRNYIRHELMPLLREHICENAAEHIAAGAQALSLAADYLSRQTERAYEELVAETERGVKADRQALCGLHPYLQSALIYEMLAHVGGRKKDIAKVHVENVQALLKGQSGRRLQTIYGLYVTADQRELHVERGGELPGIREEIPLPIGGELSFGDAGGGPFAKKLVTRLISYDKTKIIPDQACTKWLDYDKIINCPVIRNRRQGDFFYCGEHTRKKLQDYLVNEKIPFTERDRLLLVADGAHIMWIVGYRISSYYKITEQTKTVLEITVCEGENDG